METSKLQAVLEETFAANFVSYYRAHVAHVNTTGRNFYNDHKFLQKIYEFFQGDIDTLAEKIRTVRGKMPSSLETVIGLSSIIDRETEGDSIQLLSSVLDSVDAMIDQYHLVYEVAEQINYIDISNFAQDQVGNLAKIRWQLEAILDEAE